MMNARRLTILSLVLAWLLCSAFTFEGCSSTGGNNDPSDSERISALEGRADTSEEAIAQINTDLAGQRVQTAQNTGQINALMAFSQTMSAKLLQIEQSLGSNGQPTTNTDARVAELMRLIRSQNPGAYQILAQAQNGGWTILNQGWEDAAHTRYKFTVLGPDGKEYTFYCQERDMPAPPNGTACYLYLNVYLICPGNLDDQLLKKGETPQYSFTGNPLQINVGQCATLTWTSNNIDQAHLDGEGVVGNGTKQVCPDTTKTYEMIWRLRDGSNVSQKVTITVIGGGIKPSPIPGGGLTPYCRIVVDNGWLLPCRGESNCKPVDARMKTDGGELYVPDREDPTMACAFARNGSQFAWVRNSRTTREDGWLHDKADRDLYGRPFVKCPDLKNVPMSEEWSGITPGDWKVDGMVWRINGTGRTCDHDGAWWPNTAAPAPTTPPVAPTTPPNPIAPNWCDDAEGVRNHFSLPSSVTIRPCVGEGACWTADGNGTCFDLTTAGGTDGVTCLGASPIPSGTQSVLIATLRCN